MTMNAEAQAAMLRLYVECAELERSSLGGLGPLYDAWEDVWATAPEHDEHPSAWEIAMNGDYA